MKTLILGIAIAFSGISFTANAQEQEKPEMKTYTFVMLKKGMNLDQDSLTRSEIQKQHLAYLNSMAESGLLNVAGPFLDKGDWRGILIFNTDDVEKVHRMVADDPAVKAGRLIYEVHPWMTQKGVVFK